MGKIQHGIGTIAAGIPQRIYKYPEKSNLLPKRRHSAIFITGLTTAFTILPILYLFSIFSRHQ